MNKKILMIFCLVVVCFTMTGCVNPIKKVISRYVTEKVNETMEEVSSELEEELEEDTKETSTSSSEFDHLTTPKTSRNPALYCEVTATGENSHAIVYFEVKDNVNKKMEGYMITYVDVSSLSSIEGIDWEERFCESSKSVSNIKSCATRKKNDTLEVLYLFDMVKMIDENNVTEDVDLREVLKNAKNSFDAQDGYNCELLNMN